LEQHLKPEILVVAGENSALQNVLTNWLKVPSKMLFKLIFSTGEAARDWHEVFFKQGRTALFECMNLSPSIDVFFFFH